MKRRLTVLALRQDNSEEVIDGVLEFRRYFIRESGDRGLLRATLSVSSSQD